MSLNTPILSSEGDIDTEIGDLVPDEGPTPFDLALKSETKELVRRYMIEYLKPREVEILTLRFGLVDDVQLSLLEVGKIFNLTRERVRQIEHKALRKLKSAFIKNRVNLEDLL